MSYPFFLTVQDDFQAVNRLIRENLASEVPLVEEIAKYLVSAGGKRLRPLLVLLSCLSCGYGGREHVKLAAVIEFLHTAMLLHDDVVDASALRRGRKTVNAAWGNPASVLVGDFLHSRAFEMMVEIGDMKVMQILSRATNIIAEGEVQQLAHVGNISTTEADYMQIIRRKTAMLFQASSHAGAVLAKADDKVELALKRFGQHLGMAFQLVDDQLDYAGDTARLGKNVGDDLHEGKVTLPLIIAMREGSDDQRCYIGEAINARGASDLGKVIATVRATGGLEYTCKVAKKEQQLALDCLGCVADSEHKSALQSLAEFAVARQH